MGNMWYAVQPLPTPPMVLAPLLFDFPPLAPVLGKLALSCPFEDCFEESKHFSTRIMLNPIDDPLSSEDCGVTGLRYDSSNLSAGATVVTFAAGDELLHG